MKLVAFLKEELPEREAYVLNEKSKKSLEREKRDGKDPKDPKDPEDSGRKRDGKDPKDPKDPKDSGQKRESTGFNSDSEIPAIAPKPRRLPSVTYVRSLKITL